LAPPESDVNLKEFLEDADLDGRTMDAFMRDVAIWSAVFGHCWILTVKPQTNSTTRADELAQGVTSLCESDHTNYSNRLDLGVETVRCILFDIP
jgi:hypothetical protein